MVALAILRKLLHHLRWMGGWVIESKIQLELYGIEPSFIGGLIKT